MLISPWRGLILSFLNGAGLWRSHVTQRHWVTHQRAVFVHQLSLLLPKKRAPPDLWAQHYPCLVAWICHNLLISTCQYLYSFSWFILHCLYLTSRLWSYQTGWSWTRGGPSRLHAGCSGVSECPALNFPRPSFLSWPLRRLRPCMAPVQPASRPGSDRRHRQTQNQDNGIIKG